MLKKIWSYLFMAETKKESEEKEVPMFKCGKCGLIQPQNEGLVCPCLEVVKEDE